MSTEHTAQLRGRLVASGSRRWLSGQLFLWFFVLWLFRGATAQTVGGKPAPDLSKGVQLLREGRAAEAMPALNAAVKADPHSAAALTWRGICENQTGNYQAAARDLRGAVRLDATALSAHYNLALSLIRLREIADAIRELQTVVRLQPDAVPPRYNLAVLLEGEKQYADAAEQLRQAHALAADDTSVSVHLLEDLLKLREDGGVPALANELLADTTAPAMQREAGAALLEAGRFAEAAALLERVRVRDPDEKDADLMLARAYVGEGKNAEALALLSTSKGAQTDEETVYTAGLAYLGLGDTSLAAERFRVAAVLDAKDGRPLYHLALLEQQSSGGAGKAEALLRKAIQLNPGQRAFSLALARVLLASDQAEEAKSLLLALQPEPYDAIERSTLLGVALASSNEVTQAIPELQRAHTLDPQLALPENVLGFCYFRGGDYLHAAEAYQVASDLEPKRLLYARDAALANQRASANAPALHYAERAVSLPDAAASDDALLGKLYAAAGRQEDAIRLLRRAAESNPNLESALYLLARTYQRMGKPAEAAEWNKRLSAAKNLRDATFVEDKKKVAAAVHSSQVLSGGTIADESGGVE